MTYEGVGVHGYVLTVWTLPPLRPSTPRRPLVCTVTQSCDSYLIQFSFLVPHFVHSPSCSPPPPHVRLSERYSCLLSLQMPFTSLNNTTAELALALLIESCTAASAGLAEEADDIKNYPTSDFATLRTDFLSILSIIYAATTKVALSLKPSAPQPKASLVPLKDLTNNVAALVHSIRLIRVKEGATVIDEYGRVVRGVIDAVRSFALALQSSSATSTASTNQYLVRTGEVHELIDTVKKAGGLSLNNRDAVRRIFSRNHDSLADATEEVQEMCKPVNSEEHDEEEDSFDDGWEELGISSSQKLSPAELTVTEKVKSSLYLLCALTYPFQGACVGQTWATPSQTHH